MSMSQPLPKSRRRCLVVALAVCIVAVAVVSVGFAIANSRQSKAQECGAASVTPNSNAEHSLCDPLKELPLNLMPKPGQPPIPRVVWRTWKSHSIPDQVRLPLERMQRRNPGWEFRLCDDNDMAIFMEAKIRRVAPHVAEAYAAINPSLGAARADLWRYAVLWYHGGVYVDLDSEITVPLSEGILLKDDSMVASFEAVNFLNPPRFMDNLLGGLVEEMGQMRWKRRIDSFFRGDLRHAWIDKRDFAEDPWHPFKVFGQWILISERRHPLMGSLMCTSATLTLKWRAAYGDSDVPDGDVTSVVFYVTGPRMATIVWQMVSQKVADKVRIMGVDWRRCAIPKVKEGCHRWELHSGTDGDKNYTRYAEVVGSVPFTVLMDSGMENTAAAQSTAGGIGSIIEVNNGNAPNICSA